MAIPHQEQNIMERPLALYRRYFWEKKNIIFVHTASVDKLFASRDAYLAAFGLGCDETSDQRRDLETLILSASLAAESQMTRDTWGWTVRLPFKSYGLFCGVETDGSLCCRTTALPKAARHDVVGAIAVQRVEANTPVRQTMLIPRDTQIHQIVEQYFEESEQLPARLALSTTEGLLALSMPQADWQEVANLSEQALLEKFHALLAVGEVQAAHPVHDAADIAARVKAQYAQHKSGSALFQGDLKCTHEAVFFYACRCSEEQMTQMITHLPEAQQKELWKGTQELSIECPRCGRTHILHK